MESHNNLTGLQHSYALNSHKGYPDELNWEFVIAAVGRFLLSAECKPLETKRVIWNIFLFEENFISRSWWSSEGWRGSAQSCLTSAAEGVLNSSDYLLRNSRTNSRKEKVLENRKGQSLC